MKGLGVKGRWIPAIIENSIPGEVVCVTMKIESWVGARVEEWLREPGIVEVKDALNVWGQCRCNIRPTRAAGLCAATSENVMTKIAKCQN